MSNIQHFRRQIVEYGKRLYQRNYIGASEGNISVKFDRSKVLITPSGKCLGYLKPSDMVVLSAGGRKISGKYPQSSEYQLHLAIYHHRPDIKAICHAHPLYSTAYAVVGVPLDKMILPEIIITMGIIPLIEYCTPGTTELFEKMSGLIDSHDAFLLQNHGVVTLGKDLEEAFNKLEMVERYAQILFIANQIGKPWEIPEELAEKLPGYEKLKMQLSNCHGDSPIIKEMTHE